MAWSFRPRVSPPAVPGPALGATHDVAGDSRETNLCMAMQTSRKHAQSLTLAELRRLLRLLRDDPRPDPMLPVLLEMFRRESRARRLLEWDGRADLRWDTFTDLNEATISRLSVHSRSKRTAASVVFGVVFVGRLDELADGPQDGGQAEHENA